MAHSGFALQSGVYSGGKCTTSVWARVTGVCSPTSTATSCCAIEGTSGGDCPWSSIWLDLNSFVPEVEVGVQVEVEGSFSFV